MARQSRIVIGICCLILAADCVAQAQETAAKRETPESRKADAGGQFIRLTRDKRESPLALEAAIVRLVPRDCGRQGPTVDLVSAIHVAEKDYYRQLNRAFEDYDVVLYEMVAPEGTRIPKGGRKAGGNPVSSVQKAMTEILALSFQLEEIDYTRKNLVHADMSPDQVAKSMQKRGDSLMSMFLRMMGYAIARQGHTSGAADVQLLLALFDKNRALALKRIMAEQFEVMGGSMMEFGNVAGGTIIADRNKAALEVLRKQIAAGKQKIAIFYGAGHMPDFAQRLRDDFALVPISTRWLVAWDLKDQ